MALLGQFWREKNVDLVVLIPALILNLLEHFLAGNLEDSVLWIPAVFLSLSEDFLVGKSSGFGTVNYRGVFDPL